MVESLQPQDIPARLVRIENLIDELRHVHGDSAARKAVRERLSYEVTAAEHDAITSDPSESDDQPFVDDDSVQH